MFELGLFASLAMASTPPTYIDEGNFLDISVQGSGIAPSALDLWKDAMRSGPVPEGAGVANARGELQQSHALPLPPWLLQPRLAFTYQTGASAHSWLGRGWSLSTGLTVQRPVKGGERAYVGDGIADVLLVHGDGLDGMFVKTTEGWRWESATPSTAAITFLGNGDIRVEAGTRRWTLQETTRSTWHTVQARDRVGNVIDYTWTGSRLDQIDYGGTVGGIAHEVHVVLGYEFAAHTSFSAAHGELETIDQRLIWVEIETGNEPRLRYDLTYTASDPDFADDELLLQVDATDLAHSITRTRATFAYHRVNLAQSEEHLIDFAEEDFDPGTADNARQRTGFLNITSRGLRDLSGDGLPDVVGPKFQVNPLVRDTDSLEPTFWNLGASTQAAYTVAMPDALQGTEATVVAPRAFLGTPVGPWDGGPPVYGENGTYRVMRMLDVDGDGLLDRVRNAESQDLQEPLGYSVDGDVEHDLAIAPC